MNSFLSYRSCGFFMCSCIIFVPDRAFYCLFYQCLFSYLCVLPFLSVCLFKRKHSVLWLSVYFSFPSMHSPIKLQELSIILFHPWTYFWYSIENTFLVLKIPLILFNWFCNDFSMKILSRVYNNPTKPMAQALLYSKNEKTQASKEQNFININIIFITV